MRIGAINIVIDTARAQGEWIDPERVRAVLGIRPGQVYREQSLEGVSRGLYLTEAFRQVNISVDSASLVDDVDSLVTVDVTLIPGRAHAARASLGWGNLDCVRAQGSYTNYNFLGGLRRLDLTGRLSKVGVDKPFTAVQGLCTPQMRNDPLSDTLNYYASATLSQAALFRIPAIPSITVYSERRSEFEAYLRETPIGVLATVQQGIDGRLPMTWSYQLDFGRTIAQPAFFCAVFNVCEDAARSRLEKLTRTAVLGWTGTRNRSNSFASPTQGSVVRLELRHASAVIGSSPDVQFNRGVIDAAMYRPAFNGTFAIRFRAGTVLGSHLSFSGNPSFVPLQERLYGGGQNSVRGYSQNELGPALYVPDTFTVVPIAGDDTLAYFQASPQASRSRTVPTGGDNVVIANAELRLRSAIFPDLVQWALFVDAGQVWNRGRVGTGAGFRDIRVTPGAGVRLFTPIGPVRVDIGYNPYNPSPGPAYYNPVPAAGSSTSELRLICVSPGNALRVRLAHTENGVVVPAHQIDSGDCPATYAPVRGGGFLSRLTFNFSIGQAF
jgi:outer membrane protein assembly factor BamA